MEELLNQKDNVDYYELNEFLQKNCMDYAKYVIMCRAFPDLRDGCKKIHRRIVWSFAESKLTYDKPRIKSVNAVGRVLAYSPHGDASVYQACVRLANDSVLNNLIDGKGSFSSVTSRDVGAGASRYTEMRLAKITKDMLDGINKNAVNLVDNYDETRKEPEVLPVKFPLILANPNIGLGVGISTTFCSFNLNELCDYTINKLYGNETDFLVPDFPTGGKIVYDEKCLKTLDEFGKYNFKIRGKAEVKNSSIVITEIPYTTTREAIIEKIIDLVKDKKLKDVTDVNDYTGACGLNITVDFKKNADGELLLRRLYQMTTLEDNFPANFISIYKGFPRLLGVSDIIINWIEFRKECLRREIEFDINSIKKDLEKLKGLEIILPKLDETINIIRSSKTESEAKEKLKKELSLTDMQIDYICEIKLINMTKDWIFKKISKIEELEKSLSNMYSNLDSEDYYKETIKSQLLQVKKDYGQPRRTEIIEEDNCSLKDIKEVIVEDYNCQIVLTKEGYIKKTLKYSDSQKLKDGDEVMQQYASNNKNRILLFTDKANLYYLNANDLDTVLPSSLGQYAPGLIGLEDEKIIYSTSTSDFKGYMLFAFENGKVAKICMSAYQTKTNRTKIVNAYNTDSKLVTAMHIKQDVDIFCTSSINKGLLINTSRIGYKASKTSQGNMVLKSKNESVMVSCMVSEDVDEYYRANSAGIGKYIKKK